MHMGYISAAYDGELRLTSYTPNDHIEGIILNVYTENSYTFSYRNTTLLGEYYPGFLPLKDGITHS